MKDDATLEYPGKIAGRIGLGVNEVNNLKRLGCPFYGRKTCVKWVRAWLAKHTGAENLFVTEPRVHLQLPSESKHRELIGKND